MRTHIQRLFAAAAMVAIAMLAAAPPVMHAGMGSTGAQGPSMPQSAMNWTQTTPSYSVELDIGPAASMSMSMPSDSNASGNQNAGTMSGSQSSSMSGSQSSSMSGEVMVSMSGMAMPQMATMDQGQPVNHHLEVHLKNLGTGTVVTDQVPGIAITDSSGMSRPVAGVVAMYDPSAGQSDFHFGNNVYLADGMYTVTVTVGQDTATFSNVNVSGGAPLSGPSMGSGS